MPVPFPYIANVARCVFKAQRDGNDRVSVLYYRKIAGAIALADLTALAAGLEANTGPAIMGLACIGTVGVSITCTDITAAGGAEATIAWNDVGGGGADVLPANVALTFQKKTALSGRRNRGRFYAYDLSEDLFNGSTVNPLSLTPVNALAFRLAQDSNGFEPVVVSHTYGTAAKITTVTSSGIAGTMSKRLPGRGS